jgi:hypothetical protein
MQVIGWLSILIGLLYYRKVSGILLIIIGIAVVYVALKHKKHELEFMHKLFQAQIKRTRRLKKAQGVDKEPDKGDVPIRKLPTVPTSKSKGKSIKKPDWFIYTK